MLNDEYRKLCEGMDQYGDLIRGLDKGYIARVEDISSSKPGIRGELLASAIRLGNTKVIEMILDAEGVAREGLTLQERITFYQLLHKGQPDIKE